MLNVSGEIWKRFLPIETQESHIDFALISLILTLIKFNTTFNTFLKMIIKEFSDVFRVYRKTLVACIRLSYCFSTLNRYFRTLLRQDFVVTHFNVLSDYYFCHESFLNFFFSRLVLRENYYFCQYEKNICYHSL